MRKSSGLFYFAYHKDLSGSTLRNAVNTPATSEELLVVLVLSNDVIGP